MEKFLGFGDENSQTSKLAATSSKVFAKTDAQILYARGRVVPETDTRSIKVGGNLRPTADIHRLAPQHPQLLIKWSFAWLCLKGR
jgi:hypothetical protein